MEEKVLDIRELFYYIRKKYKIIIFITILTTLVGVYYAFKSNTTYLASAKILVGKSDKLLDYYSKQDIEKNIDFMSTYNEIIKIDDFLNNTLKKYNIAKSAGEVKDGIKITASDSSPIITISYASETSNDAAQVLSAICNQFVDQVKEILTGSNPKIIDSVKVIEIKPDKRKKIIMATGGGVCISLIVIFILYYLDDTVKNREKLEKLLRIPVLGEIPAVSKRNSKKDGNFIMKKYHKSISAEAYRSLRTNIKYSSIDKELKVIVITSSEPDEGKSTITGNLAISFSQSGNRVMIIDCDLRRPSLHKKFGISNLKGLTDCLIEKYDLSEVINVIDERLHIITSGNIPPNPSEVIGSKAFEQLLNKIRTNYDYIILDTPPIRAVTDGQILSAKSDGTILIVRAEKTKEKYILFSYKELKKVEAKVIGTVLNASEERRRDYYDVYYEEEKMKKGKSKRIKK